MYQQEGKHHQCSAAEEKERKLWSYGNIEVFITTVTSEHAVNIVWQLHWLSLLVFCLDMPSLAPPSPMSKQKEAMENKATGNFIILYKSAKPTEASLSLCGLQPELPTSPLKWTLLIKYCCASLPMSCQSPHYNEKTSTVAEFRSSFSRNASLHMFLCVCLFACIQRPSDNSTNGMLTGYRLYYRELQSNNSTFTEAEVQATKNNTTSAVIISE